MNSFLFLYMLLVSTADVLSGFLAKKTPFIQQLVYIGEDLSIAQILEAECYCRRVLQVL